MEIQPNPRIVVRENPVTIDILQPHLLLREHFKTALRLDEPQRKPGQYLDKELGPYMAYIGNPLVQNALREEIRELLSHMRNNANVNKVVKRLGLALAYLMVNNDERAETLGSGIPKMHMTKLVEMVNAGFPFGLLTEEKRIELRPLAMAYFHNIATGLRNPFSRMPPPIQYLLYDGVYPTIAFAQRACRCGLFDTETTVKLLGEELQYILGLQNIPAKPFSIAVRQTLEQGIIDDSTYNEVMIKTSRWLNDSLMLHSPNKTLVERQKETIKRRDLVENPKIAMRNEIPYPRLENYDTTSP